MGRRSKGGHLFSDDQLRDVMEIRRRAVLKEIDSLAPNYILNASIDDLCNYFETKYRYAVPVLDMNGVCFEQDEAEIDVSQDFHRGLTSLTRTFFFDLFRRMTPTATLFSMPWRS
jgi:hypothetical protein